MFGSLKEAFSQRRFASNDDVLTWCLRGIDQNQKLP
jgi:hypothetical protein